MRQTPHDVAPSSLTSRQAQSGQVVNAWAGATRAPASWSHPARSHAKEATWSQKLPPLDMHSRSMAPGSYVEDHGQGDPLVLVHAGLLSSGSWRAVVPLLAESFRVITFDNRGHGRSTNPSGDLSLRADSGRHCRADRGAGLERPFVGGWSDGGRSRCNSAALSRPARALIAGGTSLELGSEEARARYATSSTSAMTARSISMPLPRIRTDASTDAAAIASRWRGALAVDRPAIGEDVANVRWARPKRLSGSWSRHWSWWVTVTNMFRSKRQCDLYRWLPQAELAILPGASHLRPIFDPESLPARSRISCSDIDLSSPRAPGRCPSRIGRRVSLSRDLIRPGTRDNEDPIARVAEAEDGPRRPFPETRSIPATCS